MVYLCSHLYTALPVVLSLFVKHLASSEMDDKVTRGGVSKEHWNRSVVSEEEAQNWLLGVWPFGI